MERRRLWTVVRSYEGPSKNKNCRMKFVAALFKEVFGLLVDDQGLAFSILAVVALAAAISLGMQAPSIAGAALLLGCFSALSVSTLRARGR